MLAAGRSSRMGFPKAGIHVGGEPLIRRNLRLAHRAGASAHRVVVGHHEARVRSFVGDLSFPIRWIRNSDPDSGQTESMKRALEAVEDPDGAVMQLVDHVLPSGSTLRRLVAGVDPEGPVRIPAVGGRWGHPPFFPRWFLERISAMPPGRGINSLYDEVNDRIRVVAMEDALILLDLDRPGDLCRMRGLLSARGSGSRQDPPIP